MFELVVFLKFRGTDLQLRGKLALALLSLGPDSVCENLSVDLDSVDDTLILLDPEFLHEIGSERHVGEHFGHLVDGVVATLDFELLKHGFLSLLRDGGLVEESAREMLGVLLDEDVS
jgi:hypothetical protein